jgi:hypothetical protein
VSLGADEYEIVAVVAEQTTYSRTGGNPGDPTLYRFLPPGDGRFLVVRVDGDVGAFADAVRTAVRDAVSTPISVMNLAVEFERYVDDGSQAYQTIFVAMGSVAFALALAGIVGLGAYATRLRRKEVAIRVALGADRGDILGMLLASGLRPVPVGLLVGILTAFAAIRLFSLQMRVDALEPVPYVFAAVLLVGAVAASSLATGYWLLRWEPARPLRQD